MNRCQHTLNGGTLNAKSHGVLSMLYILSPQLVYCGREAVAYVHKSSWGQHEPANGEYCAIHAEMVRRNNSWYGTSAQIVPIR